MAQAENIEFPRYTPLASEAVLNFQDENFFGQTADQFDWRNNPCRRECRRCDPPRTCYFILVVEQFYAMSKACYDCPFNITDCYRPHCLSAAGVEKMVYVANRQLPGPSIEVCHGDTIIIEVRNRMLSESTVIHWHGINQKGSPYMDGVPYVTQCPILPGQNFRYTFEASTKGTYFWHSHIGNQRNDGLYGILIVHYPRKEDPYKDLYDHDNQYMQIADWMTLDGNSAIARQYYYKLGVNPETILVNGLARQKVTRGNETAYTPSAVFIVKKGDRYRFRLVDPGSEDCPIEMSIDNHTLHVISLDSNDIVRVEVDIVTIWPGERIDFILNANQPVGNYWIRYRGFGLCEPTDTSSGIFQVAILRYETAPEQDPTGPIGYDFPKKTKRTRTLNPYQRGTESSPKTHIAIPLLTALTPNDEALTQPVDHQIFINFDFYPLANYDFHRKHLYGYNQVPNGPARIGTFQLNHISLKLPSFPLLSQRQQIKEHAFCNSTTIPRSCKKEQCGCTHVMQVKLNSVVEFVFVDEGLYAPVDHPLHLHGHFFRVVASKNMEGPVTIEQIKKLDREGKITRRLDHAPIKDTIRAPGGGYTIVRFFADNPGYWFFHCHFEQHSNIGMAFVLKVGEHRDFPPVPKHFPQCGNYEDFLM